MERSSLRFHDLAGSLVAGRKAVAFVQRFGDHDLALAIHQKQWSGFLQRDAHAQFELRHSRTLHQFVVSAHDLNHLPRQHASPAYCKFGLTGALEDGENNRVALEKNFLRSILAEQLVDWIVKVQAEVG